MHAVSVGKPTDWALYVPRRLAERGTVLYVQYAKQQLEFSLPCIVLGERVRSSHTTIALPFVF